MVLQLQVRPVTWSYSPSFSSIQIFGYTSTSKSIYVRIPFRSTHILKFREKIDDFILSQMDDIFNTSSSKISKLDPNVMIIRADKLSSRDNSIWSTSTLHSVQDPYGEIQSFIQANNITPYGWITINKFTPLSGRYTSCDFNILADELHISPLELNLEISPKLFFWDITSHGDVISTISVTTHYTNTNKYLISTDDISQTSDTVFIKATSEKELLSQFFALYNTFKPDRQIYHNGDLSLGPHIINRLKKNNIQIPKISKILSLRPEVYTRKYSTLLGSETVETINLPDIETIDLLHYERIFGSLCQWNNNNIESICNRLRITTDKLLHSNYSKLLNIIVHNIDAGAAVLTSGNKEQPSHLKSVVKGIYRNVHVYDYSELYRILLSNSSDYLSSKLGEILKDSPPLLIMEAFYSKYVDRTTLGTKITNMLNAVIGSKLVISIDPYIIKTIGPINVPWLKIKDIIPFYVAVSQSSYITLNENIITSTGLAPVCRPKCSIASEAIETFLRLISSDKLDCYNLPDPLSVPLNKLVLVEKLNCNVEVDPDNIKYQLVSQYSNLTSNINAHVEYVMTTSGPKLLSLLQADDTIDRKYYLQMIDNYLADIRALKVYGVN